MTDAQDLGPIDSRTWPTELIAQASSVAPERRLFGYDVEQDLAAFYRFSDVLFLSLVGELPDEARSRAFEIALCFAAPASVAEAAVHAAVLARLCGARPSGVLSVASVVLAEQASLLLASLNEELEAFDRSEARELPPPLRAGGDEDRASVATLTRLLAGALDVPALRADPSRDVAIVAVFRACGVTSAFQLASLLAFARVPSALAEASRINPGDFDTYPIDTPHFEYVSPTASEPLR